MVKTRTDYFRLWLVTSRPGSSYIYHRGFLCRDREPQTYENGRSQVEEEVHELGLAAMAAEKDGLVTLTQRRIGRENYEYIATKTKHNPRAKWRG